MPPGIVGATRGPARDEKRRGRPATGDRHLGAVQNEAFVAFFGACLGPAQARAGSVLGAGNGEPRFARDHGCQEAGCILGAEMRQEHLDRIYHAADVRFYREARGKPLGDDRHPAQCAAVTAGALRNAHTQPAQLGKSLPVVTALGDERAALRQFIFGCGEAFDAVAEHRFFFGEIEIHDRS